MKKRFLTDAGHAHVRKVLMTQFSAWLDGVFREEPMRLGMEVNMEFQAHFHISRDADPEQPEINWVSEAPDYVQ